MMNLEKKKSIYKQLNRPTKRLLSQKIRNKMEHSSQNNLRGFFTFFSVENLVEYNVLSRVVKEQKKILDFSRRSMVCRSSLGKVEPMSEKW